MLKSELRDSNLCLLKLTKRDREKKREEREEKREKKEERRKKREERREKKEERRRERRGVILCLSGLICVIIDRI